ncbi:hypothetical protein [Paeniglutamicibacter cryotolerans]|uniref:Uncharacterized protein n=1 Tax=Paeniglutamicibacter cryotolerans TaxID=670079 RepID=A0A839QVK4_9MICC|nr:hypothetical protein [Paeniglutamicibacter cryotolerans]MBB2997332.1 hypothetical protein [Paeniglutamicibacter cryotolerans]
MQELGHFALFGDRFLDAFRPGTLTWLRDEINPWTHEPHAGARSTRG